MVVYNFFIFNRNGVCLYHREWKRNGAPPQTAEEEQKLMFGMLFSLKHFVAQLSPKQDEGLHCFRTKTFKMHYMETLTGLRFILNTDQNVSDLREQLQSIYANIYVPYLCRNPLYELNAVVDCDLFTSTLDRFVESLPCFTK